MNKEQALERIKAIEQEAAELRKIVEAKEPERWRAGICECYFTVISCGSAIDVTEWLGPTDDKRHAIGNYFKTMEEAEAFAKVFREVLREGVEVTNGRIRAL